MNSDLEIRKVECYDAMDIYLIDEYGNVYNTLSHKSVKPHIDKHGYYQLKLRTKDGKRRNVLVHRLVAMTFLDYDKNNVYNGGYGNGLTVDHKDGNKLNNHYTNLEWVLFLDNVNKAKDLGYNNPNGEYIDITEEVILNVINDIQNLYNTNEIMERNNVSKNVIRRITQGYRWKHLTKDLNLEMPCSRYSRDTILTVVYCILNNPDSTVKNIYKEIVLKYKINDIDRFTINYIQSVRYTLHTRYQKYVNYIQQNDFKPSTTIQ